MSKSDGWPPWAKFALAVGIFVIGCALLIAACRALPTEVAQAQLQVSAEPRPPGISGPTCSGDYCSSAEATTYTWTPGPENCNMYCSSAQAYTAIRPSSTLYVDGDGWGAEQWMSGPDWNYGVANFVYMRHYQLNWWTAASSIYANKNGDGSKCRSVSPTSKIEQAPLFWDIVRTTFIKEWCWKNGVITSATRVNVDPHVTGYGGSPHLGYEAIGVVSRTNAYYDNRRYHKGTAAYEYQSCVRIPTPFGDITFDCDDYWHIGRITVFAGGGWGTNSSWVHKD